MHIQRTSANIVRMKAVTLFCFALGYIPGHFDAFYNHRHYVWIAELKPPDMWVSTTSADRGIAFCKQKVYICSGKWISHTTHHSFGSDKKTHMISWNGVSSHSSIHCRGADLTNTGPSMVVIHKWLVTNSAEWDAWFMGRNMMI